MSQKEIINYSSTLCFSFKDYYVFHFRILLYIETKYWGWNMNPYYFKHWEGFLTIRFMLCIWKNNVWVLRTYFCEEQKRPLKKVKEVWANLKCKMFHPAYFPGRGMCITTALKINAFKLINFSNNLFSPFWQFSYSTLGKIAEWLN